MASVLGVPTIETLSLAPSASTTPRRNPFEVLAESRDRCESHKKLNQLRFLIGLQAQTVREFNMTAKPACAAADFVVELVDLQRKMEEGLRTLELRR
ncbi:MAG: hypothetical protein Q9171_005942 [Xanthocarpia ochracea]